MKSWMGASPRCRCSRSSESSEVECTSTARRAPPALEPGLLACSLWAICPKEGEEWFCPAAPASSSPTYVPDTHCKMARMS